MWTRLLSQKLNLEDLQAYVTLRGSQLSAEEKKRVIIDSDNSLEGKLTMPKVRESVRMLGASFFQEMTGVNKKTQKAKVYDQSAMVLEDSESHPEHEDFAHVTHHEDWAEDDFIDGLVHEGDEDAVFVTDFETAATDVIQSDEDLASAYSTYVEARRKLSEKYRARGFWPVSKGKGKGFKGKGRGKFQWGNRKTLQQRILESNCRLCGKKGHWKSECPSKGQSSSQASSAPVTLSMASASQRSEDAMSAEFLMLPEVHLPSQDPPLHSKKRCVQSVFFSDGIQKHEHPMSSHSISETRVRIRNHIRGNRGHNSMVAALVNRIEDRVSKSIASRSPSRTAVSESRMPGRCKDKPECSVRQSQPQDSTEVHAPKVAVPMGPTPNPSHADADVFFASHDTWGILDTGATKTVMGSHHVKSFLQHVNPNIRRQIQRCPCDVVFRFGNQGTLKSEQAMVVPVCGFHLKIAIVPGTTPFLISNTLLRALGAMVDTGRNQLVLPQHKVEIPLKLSDKGLYLIDMNMLLTVQPQPSEQFQIAETFAQESQEENDAKKNPTGSPSQHVMNNHHQENTGHATSHHSHEVANPSNNPEPLQSHNDPSTGSVKANFIEVSNAKSASLSHVPKPVLPDQRGKEFQPNVCTRTHHERLDPETAATPEGFAATSTGVSGASLPREPDERKGVIRKSSQRQDLRGGVEHGTGVDSMVPEPLRTEPQHRAPKNDQVHQDENREHGAGRAASANAESPTSEASTQGVVRQGQSHAHAKPCVHHGDQHAMDGGRCGDPKVGPVSRTNGQLGECSPSDPCPPDTTGSSKCSRDDDIAGHPTGLGDRRSLEHPRRGGCREQLKSSSLDDRNWVLQAGEIDSFCTSEPNQERSRFWYLVQKLEKEFEQIQETINPMGKSYDLFEVFCGPESKLTEQVQNLKGLSKRFGFDQGNLHTTEGRRHLFTEVCRHRPKNVWMSPVCKPWSQWSNLNSHRSVELWNKIHEERYEMLIQVALCLVLCRHQHRKQRHAHWEQPRGSHMLHLPYLNEIFQYMLCAKPDMCTAGDLRDPVNQKFMRKSMNIMTTSQSVYDTLQFQKCEGNHSHQLIEGSTHVHGQMVLRSQFSEDYPRKFARLVAKVVMKTKFPIDKPVGTLADPVLTAFDVWSSISQANAVSDRPAKRLKLSKPRANKASAEDRSLDKAPLTKRLRSKQPEVDSETQIKPTENETKISEIVSLIESQLPRVGKKIITDVKIHQMIQEVMPEKIIHGVLACKGTERTMAPPNNVSPKEAPYRRAIMKLRSSGKVIMDEWEKYDELAKRQIIRKSKPCRVNITVFAANPVVCAPSVGPVPSTIEEPASSSRMEPSANPERSSGTPRSKDQVIDQVDQERITDGKDSQESESSRNDPPISLKQSKPPVTGNRFMALSREEQAMLRRAHQNLCHPSPEQLSTVLRAQGVRPEVSQAVFDLECPTCAAHQRPKIARPSTLKSELDFNDKIFIDGITWTNKAGKSFHFYHLIDQATNYHVALPAPCRAAEHAVQCVLEGWFQWAGPPNTMVTDAATEFTSEMFTNFLQRYDVKGVTTAPHAHWQNGRCERHGHIIQNMLHKIDHDMPIQTYSDLHQALVQSTHAKNTLSIRKGYSPQILVFGKSSRVPGSIASCETEASMASADREDAHGISFRRSLELREKARVAFHRADNDMSLRRACLRRTRPDRSAYQPGEWIMMWQPSKDNGYWFGPLKVVTQEDHNSIWATQGGKIYRRALEHVRPVCSAEASQIPTDDETPSCPEISPSSITSNNIQPDNHDNVHNPNGPLSIEINDHENNPSTTPSERESQSQDQH